MIRSARLPIPPQRARAREGCATTIVPALAPSAFFSGAHANGHAGSVRTPPDPPPGPPLQTPPSTQAHPAPTLADPREHDRRVRGRDAADRGGVLVVSEGAIGASIERTLGRAGVPTRRTSATAEALRKLTPTTAAVVVAPPLAVLTPASAVRVLEAPTERADVPLYLVLDEDHQEIGHPAVGPLALGRVEVFSWPRDGLRLALSLAPI